MALVTPVELITPLVVLLGSGMNPQSTIRIAFGVMFFGKLVFHTVIRPVGWPRLHDVKGAVMGNEPVVVQIIYQIGDLREALTLHNDESAHHGFFREALPPSRRSGQREIQTAKEFIVKCCGTLGCEQRYIPNDFLSVDCGQFLSV